MEDEDEDHKEYSSMNKYKLEVTSTKLKDLESFIPLYRQILYSNEINTIPKEILFHNTESAESIINTEYFARRMGLIHFNNKNNLTEYAFELTNNTKNIKYIYSKDLINKDIEPLRSDHLLLALPPESKLNFTLNFTKGSSLENAKFGSISGLSYETKDDKLYFTMQSDRDLNQIVAFTKKELIDLKYRTMNHD